MKKMGWVLGWAVPETWFAPLARVAFPDAEHVFVASSPTALAQLEAVSGMGILPMSDGRAQTHGRDARATSGPRARPFDWVVGYSLGSLLLLSDATRAERLGRVALLAPIFAFPREKNAGGRVALAQIRQLVRWLRRDPPEALADFYRRAGLDVPEVGRVILNAPVALGSFDNAESQRRVKDNPPYLGDLAELAWGLEQLEKTAVEPALPSGWRAWCGENDLLLDVVRLREIAPEIVSVPGGGHHAAALLRTFAEAVEKVGRVIPNALVAPSPMVNAESQRRVKDNPPYLPNSHSTPVEKAT